MFVKPADLIEKSVLIDAKGMATLRDVAEVARLLLNVAEN